MQTPKWIDLDPVLLCLPQVLSCILDPLLQLCTVSASNLGTADMATYMVNSLYVMKTTLALFEFTDKRLEMLEFQVRPNYKQLFTNEKNLAVKRFSVFEMSLYIWLQWVKGTNPIITRHTLVGQDKVMQRYCYRDVNAELSVITLCVHRGVVH